MAKIGFGISAPDNTFNLNGLDYLKNRYEFYYSNEILDDNGDLDENELRIGLRNLINKEPIQTPIGITKWMNSLSIPYSSLDNLISDLTRFIGVGFSTPQASGGNIEWVFSLNSLPKPSGGVITLKADTAYYILVKNLDLEGNRLVGQLNTSIIGSTSENSSITSTGLSVGVPLFTTSFTTPIQNITFRDIDTAFNITGDSSTALDWDKFNINNCPNIGVIKGCSNWILTNSAFLNSKGLKFDGTVGTIGISNSLFVGDGLTGSIIEVLSTCNIERRFRPIYSSFVPVSNTIGITFSDTATVPVEGYILDTINFSGNGTYLSGVLSDSNKALFNNCVGIVNTSVNGQLYMRGNTTATVITDTVNFFKVAGTTIASADNSKYEHTNNRLTCKAQIERKYLVICTLSFETSSNNECEFGFFDSKLGDIRVPSISEATANSAGRKESVTFSCVVQHGFDDYLEIHCRNTTGANNITVTQQNFIITEIK